MASTDTPDSPPRTSNGVRLPCHDPFLNEHSGFSPDARKDWSRNQSAVDKVKNAPPIGESLPAAFDPNRSPAGRFVKGHVVRSGGPKKRLTKKQIFERAQMRGGKPLLRRLAAQVLGIIDPLDMDMLIPDDLETAEDFQVWVMTQRAVFSIDAFREIWDRLDPKPQKIQLDATVNAARAPISGSLNEAEAAEAVSYYEELSPHGGGASEEPEPPAEDGGEPIDLSFLE